MEALVNPATGEVVAIRPDGAHWGRKETKLFQVVQWGPEDAADTAVEQLLAGSADPCPLAALPFVKTTGGPDGGPVVIDGRREHTKYADLGELPVQTRRDILNKSHRARKVTSGVQQTSQRPAALTDEE